MRKCLSCEKENADAQTFCGFCGSPLNLSDFLSRKIAEEVEAKTRDRNILETESSIKVFERAWGWMKTVLSIAVGLAAILGIGVWWKASDLWSSVDRAKQAVKTASESTEQQIKESSAKSLKDINAAAVKATGASEQASSQINSQAKGAVRLTADLKKDLDQQAASVHSDIGHVRSELSAAEELRPRIEAMQTQLSEAINEVKEQEKTLSSSEEFAKKVFSSHRTLTYDLKTYPATGALVIPNKSSNQGAVVFLLLPEKPIAETLEIKYRIFAQPRNSYFVLQNIVVFFWADPAATLKDWPLEISYFPDTGDKDIAHALSIRDSRVYADDIPFPKFGESDPDFKGNKWMPLIPATPNPKSSK